MNLIGDSAIAHGVIAQVCNYKAKSKERSPSLYLEMKGATAF